MEFHGKVIEVCDLRKGVSPRTGEEWASMDFVVEKDGRYPVRVVFNMFGTERIKEFHPQVGEFITVHFDISARCSNGKWFNDVSCYKITRGAKQQASLNTQEDTAVAQMFAEDETLPY